MSSARTVWKLIGARSMGREHQSVVGNNQPITRSLLRPVGVAPSGAPVARPLSSIRTANIYLQALANNASCQSISCPTRSGRRRGCANTYKALASCT